MNAVAASHNIGAHQLYTYSVLGGAPAPPQTPPFTYSIMNKWGGRRPTLKGVCVLRSPPT